MNKYPLWKYALIVFVLAIGFFYAAPNLYVPDPAIQISGQSSASVIDQAALDKTSTALTAAGVQVKATEVGEQGKSGLIRLRDREQQLRAQTIAQSTLGDGYITAL